MKGRLRRVFRLAGTSVADAPGGLPLVGALFRATRREQLGLEGLGCERPREEEALHLVDVLASKVVDLTGRLDSFGERCEAEVSAELDEGADQRPRLG